MTHLQKMFLFMCCACLSSACGSTTVDTDARADNSETAADSAVTDSVDTEETDSAIADSATGDTAADAPTDTVIVPPTSCTDALTLGSNLLNEPRNVAPTGEMVPLAEIPVTSNADGDLVRVRVATVGWSANYRRIGVNVGRGTTDDRFGMATAIPAGANQAVDIDIVPPYRVVRGARFNLRLLATMADVIAPAAAAGEENAPLSGNTVGLGLVAGYTGPGWSTAYGRTLNVMVRDSAGAGLCAYGMAAPATVNVLRKTVLVVSPMAVPTLILAEGADTVLFSSQLSSNPASASAATKKVSYRFHFDCHDGSTLSLANFRMRLGSIFLTDEEVTIRAGDQLPAGLYRDVAHGAISCADRDGVVAVIFRHEVMVSGSGIVLTLHATVGGTFRLGDRVEFGHWRYLPTNFNLTGYLGREDIANPVPSPTGGTMNVPGPDLMDRPDGMATLFIGALLWSDLSDLPHSDQQGRSRDWMNTYLVSDLLRVNRFAR